MGLLLDINKEYKKSMNPVYVSFKGGFAGWSNTRSAWDYICMYGIIRVTKNWAFHLTVPGNHYSLHINTYKCKKWKFAKHFHIAFIKKFPYVLFGFKQINKYIDNDR